MIGHPSSRIGLLLLAVSLLTSGCGTLATSNNLQGKRLFQAGQYTQALSAFQAAAQRDPTNSDAYYNMAATYHHLGTSSGNQQYLTQAEMLYNESLNRNANQIDAYRGLAVLLVQTERKEQAFTLLRRWNAANPLSPEPKLELARLYHEYGDDLTAVELVAEALKVDPNHTRANRAMGMIREQQGQLAQALNNYQRAYQANTMQPDLAAKIAALQQSQAATQATADGTRMVQTPGGVPVPNAGRY